MAKARQSVFVGRGAEREELRRVIVAANAAMAVLADTRLAGAT